MGKLIIVLRWMAAMLALTLASPALAESYRMDVIVFLDKGGAPEVGQAPLLPDFRGAIELDNPAALAAAGIRILPDDQFALAESWQRLRNSKRFQPLLRLAWTQNDPPAERGPSLRVRVGAKQTISDASNFSSQELSTVEGTVAMLLNHYLMVDADLVYTQPGGSGHHSYRLKERRRMRRDELHHLDSPKLGIVARVSKASP